MRWARWLISGCAVASCAAVTGVAPAHGAPDALRAPTREESLARWAMSYAPADDAMRRRVSETARSGAPDAEAKLVAIGEPARRALLALVAEDAQIANCAAPWLARMQAIEDEVERRGLAHDVGTLSVLGAEGVARVARLVPKEARSDPVRWCAERAGSLRYEPATDRLVLREAWAADQSPFRMRGRDRISLAKTERLVGFDSAVTLEMWVRTLTPQQCYLATDEAWPELGPEVPTAVEAGFALRRNVRGPGVATLEMTCGVAPRGWWTVESAPLRLAHGYDISPRFEHIAITSDGRVVRLFRDGELVAARAVDGARFVRGVGDLCLGLRQHARSDRQTGMDVRAFRLSEGALYTADFVPPQHLDRDGATLVLLDFTPSPTVDGRTTLRDVSGQHHDGAAEGARFVPSLTGEGLRADLAAIGGGAGEVVVAEAEDGGGTGQWYVSGRDSRSGGANAEIYAENDPGPEGHAFAVPFRLPRAGRWRVHYIGAGLHRGTDGFAPFAWQVDDGPWTPVQRPVLSFFALGGESDLDLAPLGVTELPAGDHVFRMRLLARRSHPDRRWSIWFDALAFEAVP